MSKIFESEEIKNSLISLKNGISTLMMDEDLVDELYEQDSFEIDLENFSQYKLSEEDFGYGVDEIKLTMQYMQEFLEKIDNSENRQEAMKIVEEYVIKLNKLNEKADFWLLETDQREEICWTMIEAMYLKWFNPEREDITEEWRDF